MMVEYCGQTVVRARADQDIVPEVQFSADKVQDMLDSLTDAGFRIVSILRASLVGNTTVGSACRIVTVVQTFLCQTDVAFVAFVSFNVQGTSGSEP